MAPVPNGRVSEVLKVETTWDTVIDHGGFPVDRDEVTNVTEIVEIAGMLDTIVDAVVNEDSLPEGMNGSSPSTVFRDEDELEDELEAVANDDEVTDNDVDDVETVEVAPHGAGDKDQGLAVEDAGSWGLVVDDITTEEVEVQGSRDVTDDDDDESGEMAEVDPVDELEDTLGSAVGIGTIVGRDGRCKIKGSVLETGVAVGEFVVHWREGLDESIVSGVERLIVELRDTTVDELEIPKEELEDSIVDELVVVTEDRELDDLVVKGLKLPGASGLEAGSLGSPDDLEENELANDVVEEPIEDGVGVLEVPIIDGVERGVSVMVELLDVATELLLVLVME
jgi:hypothetical protein